MYVEKKVLNMVSFSHTFRIISDLWEWSRGATYTRIGDIVVIQSLPEYWLRSQKDYFDIASCWALLSVWSYSPPIKCGLFIPLSDCPKNRAMIDRSSNKTKIGRCVNLSTLRQNNNILKQNKLWVEGRRTITSSQQ